MQDEFPGNAHSNRERAAKKAPEEEQPKTEKRVEKLEGVEVVRRKKPFGRRFFETFFGGDAKTVVNYVLMDVLVPAAKDMVADAVSQGVERTLFGEARSRSRRTGFRGGDSAPWTSYNRFSSPDRSPQRAEQRREISRASRSRHDFGEIVLDNRVHAEQVLDNLIECLSKYGTATVADLYDLVEVTSSFTDSKWGWTDLRGADISRVRDGYLLDLPRPEPLD